MLFRKDFGIMAFVRAEGGGKPMKLKDGKGGPASIFGRARGFQFPTSVSLTGRGAVTGKKGVDGFNEGEKEVVDDNECICNRPAATVRLLHLVALP